MKISILTNNFPPLLDGVGDYSFHLANEFRRNGHEVAVICRQDVAIQEAARRGQFGVPVSAIIPTWNWRAIRPLQRFLRRERPDWLLVQYVPNAFQRWAMPAWLPLLLWLAKREGVQVSITFHELYVRLTYWPLKYWIVAIMQRGVCILLTHVANVLITSIDLYADLLRSHTRKPVYLIPIGSNILPMLVTDDELLAIRERIAPNGEAVICTFGLRSQDLLLEVFEQVLRQRPHTRLLICSQLNVSVSQRECYERLKDKIVVTGFMDAPDVYRHLRATDVFFMPDYVSERGEGGTSNKSTSLAAGLAAGLPIVGTRGDMNNALLLQTPGVSLENSLDKCAIAGRVMDRLEKSDNCGLREDIIRFSARHLSWEAIVRQYFTAIRQLNTMENEYTATR